MKNNYMLTKNRGREHGGESRSTVIIVKLYVYIKIMVDKGISNTQQARMTIKQHNAEILAIV